LIKKDREHLEARARRFLKSFLKADENGKPQFYRVVEDAVQRCQADAGVGQPSTELEDEQVARATSAEAMKIFWRWKTTRPVATPLLSSTPMRPCL
jgi:hypothetical protein